MYINENMNMSIKLVVDYREDKLLQSLQKLQAEVGFEIECKPLQVGDVLIECTGTHAFTLLYERKTAADLEASIKDGRYSEQKARMLSLNMQCTYILEGVCMGDVHNTSSIDGAIIHTMYRDKMHVITTKDVDDTAGFLYAVYKKCVANPQYFVAEKSNICVDYVATLKAKTKKIDNIDKTTCYIMQLCQIPGVSHKIAKEIAATYPTMQSLLTAIATDPGALLKIKMIASKKAKVIIDYLV
jgi:ERCC4-type nuclease